ncbi:probable ATP-dependent RNA helicase DDX52 [Trichonephila inaurata madagascariensis]|uniref:Probable ATP-dependent RNA helicase DDX52 n=1 Tax=Trichonephila inaurata madagascariensis TaxID=2747483 RepID=A0A8X6WPQ0_9ARAC|nr:probable ATP-dependent RNA helicase DDX52 [Trichonephila inaurata madagascariensis]
MTTRASMGGFELFTQIAFGTPFDPKKVKKIKNENSRRNKRKRLKETQNEQTDYHFSKKRNSKHESSDSSEDSEIEANSEAPKIAVKKKEKKRLSAMQLFKIRKEEVAHFRKVNRIYLTGEDVPDPIEEFNQLVTDYGVDDTILHNIYNLGYSKPTPIQMQALPLMLHNRQILASAPTGSGKTAAFLVPLIHSLKTHEEGGLRAVIIAPTRELVKQIHSFCLKLSEGTSVRSVVIENVKEIEKNPKFLEEHDILISTPNRLIYMLKNDPPIVTIKNVQWLIVDECDKLFETGKEGTSFRDQLAFIYNACDSSNLKRALFSATFSQEVETWCKLYLDSLVCVSIGAKNSAVQSVKQELLFVGCEGGKLFALRNSFQEGFMPPCLIFVQSKERAKELYSEIVYTQQRVGVIHADLSQEERDKVVKNFTDGKIWTLICTELMGRGIDFKDVKLVINYDFPPSGIAYIHRIGRTGRAGATGRAITYFTSDDVENLKTIAQVIKDAGCEVPSYIMNLKTKKKRRTEFNRPIKREKITTASTYDVERHINNKKRKKQNEKEGCVLVPCIYSYVYTAGIKICIK